MPDFNNSEYFKEGSLLREYLENAPDGVCVLDMKGSVLYGNRKSEEIIGYGRNELIGKNLIKADIVAADSKSMAILLFNETLKGRQMGPKCIEMIHKDGRTVPIEISTNLIRHDNREIILEFIRDITERRKAEQASLESKKILHSLFSQANDAIFLIKNYVFTDCNLKTLEMFGCTKEDIINRSPVNFSTECQYDGISSLKKGTDILNMAKKGVPQFFEWCHCRKDGTPFDTEVSLSCLELGGENYIQAIVRDITGRKKAQEEALRQREMLQTLSDNAPFGMVLINAKEDFIYMNARFTELLGYDLSDIPNGRMWFQKAYPDPKYRQKPIEAWKEDSRGPNIGHPRVFVVTCKNGTTKTLNLVLSMLSSGDCLMTCEDITEVKRLESRLKQAQKMESLGTLAGGIVHDFNNILTVLMGYASLIKVKIKNDTDLHAYVDQIFSTSKQAADLTRQLLTFSRRQPVVLAPVDINEVVKSTEKILRKLLTEDIEMYISLAAHLPAIMADRSQMEQILFNLVTNAKDAMKNGGKLFIETEITRIDSRFIEAHAFGNPGTYVMISVSDTGEGMDEATREKIFEPFFTTKEMGKGTGLGLATVYGVIKQHNGYITAYSESGQGATFRIYLPVTATRVRERKDAVIPVSRGREKILIAEDEKAVREMICEALREYGYTAMEAIDGQDAIERYKLHPDVNLAILDLVMPKKNGRKVYEEIRSINPNAKVLFISGYTKDVVINKGIQGKGFNFMAKPLLFDKLLQKVREILDT